MKDDLDSIFENVNNWLKFAETKNAMLVGFNAACLFALLKLLEQIKGGHWLMITYVSLFAVCTVISLILCLLSFAPLTKVPWMSRITGCAAPNMIFFGHLKSMGKQGLLKMVAESTGKTDATPTKLEMDYADQIIINSKIADKKYTVFRVGLWFTISAFLTPLVGLVLYFILDPNANC